MTSGSLRVSPLMIAAYTLLQISPATGSLAFHYKETHSKRLDMNAQIGMNEYNSGVKEKVMMCCTRAHLSHIIEIPPVVMQCKHIHTAWLTRFFFFIKPGAHSQLQALAGPGRGVVPLVGCLLKAHFTTMMLFPDQTWAWNADRNGLGASDLLLNFKNPSHFFGRFDPIVLGGRDHTDDYRFTRQPFVVAPKTQQQFKGNESYPKSTNTSHARKVCMQSVEAFPALFLFSWPAYPLKLCTFCSLH